MADTTTEDLISSTTLDGTELIHIVQGGNSRQANVGDTGGGNAGLGDILQLTSEKGQPFGYAPLNVNGRIARKYVPYADDVKHYDTFTDFPATGFGGNIYIADDTNLSYTWNAGTMTYDLSSAVPDSTDTMPEGEVNKYFTDERAQDAVGAMVDATLVYVDGTPVLKRAVITGHITIADGSNAAALGSFTKSQLDTAVSDGNILYVGDVTQYTDEMAQDAVGAMIDSTLEYVDATPLLRRAALTGAITATAGSNTTALGSFTKSQLDTAVSDGNVLYTGDLIGTPFILVVAVSDETTALTTGTAKTTFRMPAKVTLSSVKASVTTAPTGASLIVDVKESGTTIFSAKPTIAASAKTTVGGSTITLSDTSLADDAEMTINIDQIGSTIAGAGLKVTFIGTYAS